MKTATAVAAKLLANVRIEQPGNEASERAEQALKAAEARHIANDEDFTAAATDLAQVKTRLAEVEGMRKTLKDPILKAGKAIDDFFRGPIDFLTRAETNLKRKLYAYTQEVNRKRAEAQARADEAARKERLRLEQQAAKAREKGKDEKAEVLEQRAADVIPVNIQTEAPRVAGVQMREKWEFDVVNEAEVPREYTTPDLVKIGKVVRALKGDTKIPGIKVRNEGNVSAARG